MSYRFWVFSPSHIGMNIEKQTNTRMVALKCPLGPRFHHILLGMGLIFIASQLMPESPAITSSFFNKEKGVGKLNLPTNSFS